MGKQIDGIQWTSERPQFQGTYLVKIGSAIQEVSVVREDDELMTISGCCVRPVRNYSIHCLWAGPFGRVAGEGGGHAI